MWAESTFKTVGGCEVDVWDWGEECCCWEDGVRGDYGDGKPGAFWQGTRAVGVVDWAR